FLDVFSHAASASKGPATPEGPRHDGYHQDDQGDGGVAVLPALFGGHVQTLFDDRGRNEGVERSGRGHGPFQAGGAFPGFGGGGLAAAVPCLEGQVQEDELRQAEPEGAYGGDFVEVGELRRVIRITARHAGQAQEVHGEEGDVERNHAGPEVPLAQFFVVHTARPLRQPVVGAGVHAEQ